MKVLGNILWCIFTGIWMAMGYFLLGLIWCATIIGIPFGVQCIKLSALAFLPFGRKVKVVKKHPVANILWLIFLGFTMVIGFCIGGVLWCITIIGIPFGKQCFKLAKLSLTPFGRDIE